MSRAYHVTARDSRERWRPPACPFQTHLPRLHYPVGSCEAPNVPRTSCHQTGQVTVGRKLALSAILPFTVPFLFSLAETHFNLWRFKSLRCALRSPRRNAGAAASMASPSFRSSASPGRRESGIVISSSPDLPPLKDLLSRKPNRSGIRSGSRAAPIPKGKSAEFTTAAELWKSQHAENEATAPSDLGEAAEGKFVEGPTVVEISPETDVNPRKSSDSEHSRSTSPSTSHKKKASQDCAYSHGNSPWKKYKLCMDATTGNKCPVTPRKQVNKNSRQLAELTAFDDPNSHFQETVDRPSSVKDAADFKCESPQLEKAPVRRRDWTPPAQRNCVVSECAGPSEDNLSSSSRDNQTRDVFGGLLERYGCDSNTYRIGSSAASGNCEFLTKRKAIDMVVSKKSDQRAQIATKLSSQKGKASRKKPRTITELATAAYKVASQSEAEASSVSTLEKYLEGSESGNPANLKRKNQAKSRKGTSRSSKVKAELVKSALLSPVAALRQVAHQDYVFGTSSQLAVEHSPTFLRDLHSAMRDSNLMEGDDDFMPPIYSDPVEPSQQQQRLWNAGSRNQHGDLFGGQEVNLINSHSPLQEALQQNDPFGYIKEDAEGCLPQNPVHAAQEFARNDDSFINLSDVLPPQEVPNAGTPERNVCWVGETLGCETLASNDHHTTNKSALGSFETTKEDSGGEAPRLGHVESSAEPSRPRYELYTDAQLSREIALYGFKSLKRRSAMISLLDRCWHGSVQLGQAGMRALSTSSKAKSRKAAEISSADAGTVGKKSQRKPRQHSVNEATTVFQERPQPVQSLPSPERRRGRPRKDSTCTTAQKVTRTTKASRTVAAQVSKTGAASRKPRTKVTSAVLEIPDSASDSGSEVLSSLTCLSPERTLSSPTPIDLSISMEEDSGVSMAEPEFEKEGALFGFITQAITTAPRSTDAEAPSWHERILLYDPVVLEDLAAWLNSGQLTRVGCDSEVSPGELKKWCEARSICCLWRVNLRGEERKRY